MMKQETLDEIIERMVQDCRAEMEIKETSEDSSNEVELVEKYVRQSNDSVTVEF